MDHPLGLLKVRVKRGINLAVRDVRTSDPYVVIQSGEQKLKTNVICNDVNPEWNEVLTLFISDPDMIVKLIVYDHDTFTPDDKMGDAFFDIKAYIAAVKMDCLKDLPEGKVISTVLPSCTNCLAEESQIVWSQGNVTQNLRLRLRNVERGEVEVSLNWFDVPGTKGP